MGFHRARRSAAGSIFLTLLALACGGGGDGGGGTPTGPDDASSRAVGSISLVAGGGQSVGPATIVPNAPTVQVKSDRGNALRGATVVLSVENGRGTLDASSVTTDASGNASFPRWVSPLTVGEFAVSAVASGASGGSATVRVTASVVDAAQQSITQAVGATGGTISIPSSVPPLGGLQITVPPGSFGSGSTTFSVQYGPAPQLPAHLTLASPLIGISAGATPSDSIIDIRIPATGTASAGQTLRAFAVAADNGLIPIPTKSSDASFITIGITDFRGAAAAQSWAGRTVFPADAAPTVLPDFGIRVLVAFWTVPTSGTYGVGFAIGRDNMGFVNYGSFTEPGGFCAGSTVAAGGWFRKKSGAALLTARAQFPSLLSDAETGGWAMTSQLNPAVRLASEMQRIFGGSAISNWRWDRVVQGEKTVWENVLYQLTHGGQPVFLAIWNAALTTGHAILAHRVDVGTGQVFVADPNYPESDRFMQWNAGTSRFDAFMASANRGTPNSTAYVFFADASYLFWEQRTKIAGVIDAYNANRLVAQYPNATGVARRKNGTEVSIDNPISTFDIEARDNPLTLNFNSIGSGVAHVINARNGVQTGAGGIAIVSNNTTLTIPVEFGQNKIGVVLEKTSGPGQASWFDAKLIVANRAWPTIKFLQQPAKAKENESIPVKVGLVDEAGNAVAGIFPLFLELQGGAAGAVLAGGGAFNTLADGTAMLSLSVNKAGTGYTLRASGTNLAPVTSSAFDIEADGSFTGRVVDGVTGQGLGGVSIVVDNGLEQQGTTSLPNGDWTVTGIGSGTFNITATMTGFVPTTLFNQVLTPPSTVVEPIPLVPDASPGGVFGQIRNAINAQLVTSLTTVEARAGMNATTGPVAFSQNTSTGTYALPNLPAGVYTLTATHPSFHSTSRTGVVVGGGPANQGPDLVMNPLGGGVARIVLTWGASPSDLDSHLTGPTAGGARFWRYYASPGNCQAAPFACLDVDDISGYGPETMTIGQLTPGVYRYYVYDFSNRTNNASTALGSSGAKVQLFVGGQVHNFFVPSGTGNAWAVFTWDGTTVTPLNQLYTISGVPTPARIIGPALTDGMMTELQRLRSTPPKR